MRIINSLVFAAVVGSGWLVPDAARAEPILQGGTETLTGAAYLANFMNGYDFVPTTNQSLTALGFWDESANGLPRSFQVGVWATATQTLLASAFLDSTDPIDLSVTVANGNWRYESLGALVALTSGTTYTLAWQVGSPDLSATDSLILEYSSLVVDPDVTVPDLGRSLATSAFTFPTSTTAPVDVSFRGNVNAQLTPTIAAVPEPSSLVLLGAGVIAALVGLRRRRAAL